MIGISGRSSTAVGGMRGPYIQAIRTGLLRAMSGSVGLIFIMGATLVFQSGCNSQPQVSSRDAMQLIKQAYTACNTRNVERLASTESRFSELVAAGTLTESEQRAFQEIFDLARDGNWQKAQDRAFSFALAQVR